jgi:hypothetical protein
MNLFLTLVLFLFSACSFLFTVETALPPFQVFCKLTLLKEDLEGIACGVR